MCQSFFFERCRKLLLQKSQQNTPGGNQYMSLTKLHQQNTQQSQLLDLFGCLQQLKNERNLWAQVKARQTHLISWVRQSANRQKKQKTSLANEDLPEQNFNIKSRNMPTKPMGIYRRWKYKWTQTYKINQEKINAWRYGQQAMSAKTK